MRLDVHATCNNATVFCSVLVQNTHASGCACNMQQRNNKQRTSRGTNFSILANHNAELMPNPVLRQLDAALAHSLASWLHAHPCTWADLGYRYISLHVPSTSVYLDSASSGDGCLRAMHAPPEYMLSSTCRSIPILFSSCCGALRVHVGYSNCYRGRAQQRRRNRREAEKMLLVVWVNGERQA